MMNETRVMLSIGTRPEVIKMAPLYLEFKKRGIRPVLLHTGQHNEMASSLYRLFDVMPDYNLPSRAFSTPANDERAKEAFCELSEQSSDLLQNISRAMMEADPQLVLVHGDTSSALMSALAAFYQKRPIAHIEAGLRSGNEYNPFPEEKNRVLIGKLAHWHFAPTRGAKNNLLEEGIPEDRIHVVGNTIVDATKLGMDKIQNYQGSERDTQFIGRFTRILESKKLLMVTVHRRENHGANIKSVARAILNILQKHQDMVVVWPVHPNPKVRNAVHSAFAGVPVDVTARLHLTEPLNYPVLLWLLKHSWTVLTDSGGIQEEAVALGTPVMVLRSTTERPEVMEVGAGLMVGTGTESIVSHVEKLLSNSEKYNAMRSAENPFGNGTAAANICDILIRDNFSERKYA